MPIIVYSMICFGSWLFRPVLSRYLAIRCGIYLGLGLTFQFLVIVLFSTGPVTLFAAVIVGPLLSLFVYGLYSFAKNFRRFTIRHLLILTTVVALFAAFLRLQPELLAMFFGIDVMILVAAPTLAIVTYARASLWLLHQPIHRRSVHSLIAAWFACVIAWILSWRLAVTIMLFEYSKLPTTAPKCYVSSAAAHGHPGLVRSQWIWTEEGVPVHSQSSDAAFEISRAGFEECDSVDPSARSSILQSSRTVAGDLRPLSPPAR